MERLWESSTHESTQGDVFPLDIIIEEEDVTLAKNGIATVEALESVGVINSDDKFDLETYF